MNRHINQYKPIATHSGWPELSTAGTCFLKPVSIRHHREVLSHLTVSLFSYDQRDDHLSTKLGHASETQTT